MPRSAKSLVGSTTRRPTSAVRRYIDSFGLPQLWLDDSEIEAEMVAALTSAGMGPGPEAPAVDLERFLEVGLRATLDQHAVLDKDLLGVTSFARGLPPVVQINADLTGAFDAPEAGRLERARWRSTLAHEAAHVVLHARLFLLDEHQGELFSETAAGSPPQRCLKRDVGFNRSAPDPREVQANKGMAALLMPGTLFVPLAREAVDRFGLRPGDLDPTASGSRRLITTLAEWFQVSRQAAQIRLGTFGFLNSEGQPPLGR